MGIFCIYEFFPFFILFVSEWDFLVLFWVFSDDIQICLEYLINYNWLLLLLLLLLYLLTIFL